MKLAAAKVVKTSVKYLALILTTFFVLVMDGSAQTQPSPTMAVGVYRDNAIRYEGEPAITNGGKTLSRLTFFKIDGNTVRQLAENSVDDGKTWTVRYDFKYVRKK